MLIILLKMVVGATGSVNNAGTGFVAEIIRLGSLDEEEVLFFSASRSAL